MINIYIFELLYVWFKNDNKTVFDLWLVVQKYINKVSCHCKPNGNYHLILYIFIHVVFSILYELMPYYNVIIMWLSEVIERLSGFS